MEKVIITSVKPILLSLVKEETSKSAEDLSDAKCATLILSSGDLGGRYITTNKEYNISAIRL